MKSSTMRNVLRRVTGAAAITATCLMGITGLSTPVFAQVQVSIRSQGSGGPVAEVPVTALTAGLQLTAEQSACIAQMQQQLRDLRRTLLPQPQVLQQQTSQATASDHGGTASGTASASSSALPAGTENVRAEMARRMEAERQLREAEQRTEGDIRAVLTRDQREALPALLKELSTLEAVGIPADLYATLGLTSDQREQISAIGRSLQRQTAQRMSAAGQQRTDPRAAWGAMETVRQHARERAMSLLTDAQRDAIAKYVQAHPTPLPPTPENGR